jgi:hypothetical protein
LLLGSDRADEHFRVAQVGRRFNTNDRYEAQTRIANRTGDMRADLFSEKFVNARHPFRH